MTNIWKYKDADMVKLVDADGKVFIGKMMGIIDASEFEDVYDNPEDELNLDTFDGEYYAFKASEITSIEELSAHDLNVIVPKLAQLV